MKKALALFGIIAGAFLFFAFFPLSGDRLTDWAIGQLGKRFGGKLEAGEIKIYLFPLRVSFSRLSYQGQALLLTCERGKTFLKLSIFKRPFLSFERVELEGLKLTATVGTIEGNPFRPPLPGKELEIRGGVLELRFERGSFKAKVPYAYLNKKQKKAYVEVEPFGQEGSFRLLVEKHRKWYLSANAHGFEVGDLRGLVALFRKGSDIPWIESGKVKVLELKGVVNSWYPFVLSELSAKGEVLETTLKPLEGLRLDETQMRFELEGERLKVRGKECLLGTSILREAEFQFHLNKREFFLSSEVQTSVDDLSRFLPLLVKSKGVKEVLDTFSESRGTLKGYLVITGAPGAVELTATIDDLSLEVRHRGMPTPLKVVGSGRVSKEGMVLLLKTLEGRGVKLLLAELKIPFGKGTGTLEAKGGQIDLDIWASLLKLQYPLLGTLKLKKATLAFEIAPFKVKAFRVQGIPNLEFSYSGRTFGVFKGLVEASQQQVAFKGVSIEGSGAQGKATGEVHLDDGSFTKAHFSLDLSFTEEFVRWIFELLAYPRFLKLNQKGRFEGDISFEREGYWGIKGGFSFEEGLYFLVDAKGKGDLIEVRELKVVGPKSDAIIAFNQDSEGQILRFSGDLAGEDAKRFLEVDLHRLKGDFVYEDKNGSKIFLGWCELDGDMSQVLEGLPLNLNKFRVEGKEGVPLGISGSGNLLGTEFEGRGSFDPSHGFFDLKLKGDKLDWERFQAFFEKRSSFETKGLKGRIDAEVKEVNLKGLKLKEAKGTVDLDLPSGWRVDLKKGDLCGLTIEGTVNSLGCSQKVELSLWAPEVELGPVTACLGLKEGLADGVFLMEAKVSSGQGGLWGDGSRGSLYLYSRKGRVYKLTALSKLFALLNATEILRGRVPDLTGKGFPYDRFEVAGKMMDGVLFVEEGVIEGQALKIFLEGKVDLRSGKVDLTVLVAPFRTFDVLLSNIPILGYVLTGKSKTFLSLPFKVEGDFRQPEIFPLPPQAIGKGLLGIVERTLKVPIKLVEPFASK